MEHDAWALAKQREEDDLRYEKELKLKKEQKKKKYRQQKSEESYKKWLVQKESYERALQLMGETNPDRVRDDDTWFEMAVCLAAIDVYRGVYKQEEYQGFPIDRDIDHNVDTAELKKRRPLEDVFYKWSRGSKNDGHEFMDVTVPPEEAQNYTLGAQNMMAEYAEEALQRKGEFVQSSLKYAVPKIVQKAHDKRNLFNPDTAKYNAIFFKLCRAEYRRAQTEMLKRLDKAVDVAEEEAAKSGTTDSHHNIIAKAEKRNLYRQGLARLAKWVEEDAISFDDQKKATKKEERQLAIDMHKQYLDKKNRMRIKLPPRDENNSSTRNKIKVSRMDFTNNRGKKGLIRKKEDTVPKSSVEIALLGGSDAKYVFCHNKGDLLECRKYLERIGCIYKENYLDEDGDVMMDAYEEAKRAHKEAKKKKVRQADRDNQSEEQYKLWAKKKDLRDKAIHALQHVGKPGEMGVEQDERHWKFVAEQLKSVDTTLLAEFTAWAADYKSAAQCKRLWEVLPPHSCDTCCATSMVHKTLLKILNRPGLNFSQVFDYAVNDKLKRVLASDGLEIHEATEEQVKQVLDSLELRPKKFARLMEEAAGIVLKDHEIRILMTLFDKDGNGAISRCEFLQFTGHDDRPTRRGDALQTLRSGRFCVWEACCHVTGMSNAFDVIPQYEDSASQSDEDEYSADSDMDDQQSHKKDALPLLLRNGKPKAGWQRYPLPDYLKRKARLLSKGQRTDKDFAAPPPTKCQLACWKMKERTIALDALQGLAEGNKQLALTVAQELNGEAPKAPELFIDNSDLNDVQRMTCLNIKWRAAKSSAYPSFYILETSGREGSRNHRNHVYEELFRDPPSASSGVEQVCGLLLRELEPNTRYYYRIRAFNGHGPSSYTFASFSTAPQPPVMPTIVSTTPTTVTLSWSDSLNAQNLVRSLKDMFKKLLKQSAHKDKYVDRNELLTLVDNSPELVDLLADTSALPAGFEDMSVLDYLEADDTLTVSFGDLSACFNHLLEDGGGKGGGVRTTRYILCICLSDEEVDEQTDGRVDGSRAPGEVLSHVLKSSEWFINRTSNTHSSGTPKERRKILGSSNALRNSMGEATLQARFDLPRLQYVEAPEPLDTCVEKPSLKVMLSKGRLAKEATTPRRAATPTKAKRKFGSAAATLGDNGFNTHALCEFKEHISHLEVLEPVYVGTETTATVTGLKSGMSYQFRVQAINTGPTGGSTTNTIDKHTSGQTPSRLSDALIVHTPIDKPPALTVVPDSITCDSVYLRWDRPVDESLLEGGSKQAGDWSRVIDEWTKDANSDISGSVSGATLRKVFMKYDLDCSGFIEADEMALMFGDLGLPTKGARFNKAAAALDTSGDGKVSYQEFHKWYQDIGLQFTVLSDSGATPQPKSKKVDVQHSLSPSTRSLGGTASSSLSLSRRERDNRGGPLNVVCYQGEDTEALVGNLKSNTAYRFAMKYSSHKTSSVLSNELVVVTLPEAPPQPIIVSVDSKAVLVKWYHALDRASRFSLEVMLVETLKSSTSSGGGYTSKRLKPKEWTEVFNGKETMHQLSQLVPNSVYKLRVRAMNCNGLCSEASLPTQVATSRKPQRSVFSKANAAKCFTIECTGDIVVGDTILFTERVFDNSSSSQYGSRSRKVELGMSQQSVSSLTSQDRRRLGNFVTERTIAARVVGKRSDTSHVKQLVLSTLVLEVVWSTISKKDDPGNERYLLKPGVKISRKENDVFKFETFRAPWVQEESRWTADEERDAAIAQ